jgi:hypothetical protein
MATAFVALLVGIIALPVVSILVLAYLPTKTLGALQDRLTSKGAREEKSKEDVEKQ